MGRKIKGARITKLRLRVICFFHLIRVINSVEGELDSSSRSPPSSKSIDLLRKWIEPLSAHMAMSQTRVPKRNIKQPACIFIGKIKKSTNAMVSNGFIFDPWPHGMASFPSKQMQPLVVTPLDLPLSGGMQS